MASRRTLKPMAHRRFIIVAIILTMSSLSAQAYVGPGAGFAFVSSFFILFAAFFLSFLTLLTWPIKFLVKALLSRRKSKNRRAKRVVIVGLDGQDPDLTRQFMAQGLLPNFSRLAETGSFTNLGTSLPAESPVAWSCFQTGCNPGKHRIYDFLVPNRKSMLPELSSAHVQGSTRTIKLGKYRIPVGRPRMRAGRKSQPFWKLLGDHGIFSSILRVPITFPPEKFKGVLLSAMCLPDLKGSQGTYFYYTSNPEEHHDLTSGVQLPLTATGSRFGGAFTGPENALTDQGDTLQLPFQLEVTGPRTAQLFLGKDVHDLEIGTYTPWLYLDFKPGLGMTVRGICRLMLLETDPHVRLYVTPIQIDPEKPALPISHPFTYSVYLAKTQGPFATLGVAEDTSALNEGIIDEDAFLEQCTSIHREREIMFFDALKKTPSGAVVCVFDITDRVQHMFFRFMDDGHPACVANIKDRYARIIRDLYVQMDDLVGRVAAELDDDCVLMVLSDHGFKAFRREFHLNAWLAENGFLTIKPGGTDKDLLQGIDWTQTQAFSVGFGGIYLNVKGRESAGIVDGKDEVKALKERIIAKLKAHVDPETGERPIAEVYDRDIAYNGPYVGDAPDLVAGFRLGYRAAWGAVTGGVAGPVLQDNQRPWSGDHNMNPPDVPGMFFCNKKLTRDTPHIQDIAPTVLDLFGIAAPSYMDGTSFMQKTDATPPPKEETEA